MLVETIDLKRSFGNKQAVDGVCLQISPGEIVGLAGPNGAGKTTMLRMMMGFLEPDSGQVRVLGIDPKSRRSLGEIGWMPESPAFPARFSFESLLEFQAATYPTWDQNLALELEDRLEIDRNLRTSQMSRGQASRLALLFALAHRPRLLILDDPTLGLDPSGRRLLLGELLGAACEAGTGILISTHLLAEAEWSLDRLAILKDGRLIVDEAVDDLKARCRKLQLPPGTEAPAEFKAISLASLTLSTTWNQEAWIRFRSDVPEASVESLRIEDLYVSLMEDA